MTASDEWERRLVAVATWPQGAYAPRSGSAFFAEATQGLLEFRAAAVFSFLLVCKFHGESAAFHFDASASAGRVIVQKPGSGRKSSCLDEAFDQHGRVTAGR